MNNVILGGVIMEWFELISDEEIMIYLLRS